MTDSPHSARVRRALLLGAVTVGTLDGLDALIFFGLRGVAPMAIFQSIASGLLGSASFKGGLGTALLGVLLHYLIAFLIVGTYFLLSTRIAAMASSPFLWGPIFGVVAYLVMEQVVLPLSAAHHGHSAWPVIANGVLIHMFGVGLPSALYCRWSRITT